MNEIRKILRSAFSLESDSDTAENIRAKVVSGAQVRGTNMCILVLAIFIASIGLNMNSTAVIIGAMLISPLMGGIMAIGYGIAVNDLPLARKAFVGLLFQVVVCIVTSTVYFSLSPISTAHSELLARTTPTIWDVMIALFGGLAGIIGVTRAEKTNVLPGVAIATALMPPLCTAGYGIAMRSMQFFAGALYLFFINSFFICVSTVIIVRVMHLPRKKFIDRAARVKVKAIIWVIAVVTVLPSIYLGWQIVNESIVSNNIDRYISTEFSFADTQVVRTATDQKAGEIRVAVIGKRLSDERIAELQNAMASYGLRDLTLKVTQTEIAEGVGVDAIQQIIEQELDENARQSSLLSKSQKADELEAENVRLKAQLLDYQSTDYDVQALSRELLTLYPQITDCSVGRHKFYSAETREVYTGVVVTLTLPHALGDEESARIVDWFETRTDASPVLLYQNATEDDARDLEGLEKEEIPEEETEENN